MFESLAPLPLFEPFTSSFVLLDDEFEDLEFKTDEVDSVPFETDDVFIGISDS